MTAKSLFKNIITIAVSLLCLLGPVFFIGYLILAIFYDIVYTREIIESLIVTMFAFVILED